MIDVPFMISNMKNEELEVFNKTEYAQILNKELDDLIKEKKITSLQKEIVIAIKASEFYNYCVRGNAWGSVKYYLEQFPEIFKIHDLLFIEETVEKFFYIINSKLEGEFEKILNYQKLSYEKYQKRVNGGRTINIYVGYIKNPEKYSLNEHPVRKACRIAGDAGIRIGFHYYLGKEQMEGFYDIGNIRSFPIELDEFGDFSRAGGGFREDLKAGFKSTWEANIARLLNFKNLDWEYEKASESYVTEIGAYIPDFKVKKGEKTYIIEVKGFWDDRSVKKVWSAMTQTKDEKIIIIDSDYYALLDEKFSKTISNWESTNFSRSSFVTPVIGITVGNRLTTIQSLNEGEQLKLLREADNPYDSNAIKIVTHDNEELGYIAKEWASIFAFKIDSGFSYEVILKKKDLGKKRIFVNLITKSSTTKILNNLEFL